MTDVNTHWFSRFFWPLERSSLGKPQKELKFVEGDQSSHKQVLTLYNPYDFNIQFEVFSNAPKRYAVVESKGLIKAHCCVDIVIRHQTVGLGEGPFNTKDKFKIDIYYNRRVIGRKLIPSTLVNETKEEKKIRKEDGDFGTFGATPPRQLPLGAATTGTGTGSEQSPGLWLVVMALLCLLVLLLPLEGESLTWPSYLHITVNQKLIAAFALGLVTMAILKS